MVHESQLTIIFNRLHEARENGKAITVNYANGKSYTGKVTSQEFKGLVFEFEYQEKEKPKRHIGRVDQITIDADK